MIRTVINVEAPRDHVFHILTDYPKYKKWLPGCEKCDVTASTGNTTDTEIVVNGMKKMRMGLRFEAQPSQLLSFRMLASKDLKAYSGCYRLMDAADGKGTVVIAEMEVDASVPKFLLDRVVKKSIEETGNALRQYIGSIPFVPGTVFKAAAAGRPAESKPRRAKRILQVVRTPDGYSIWIMGETYKVKRQAG
jgi:uncharacterized protein YndB with AHSA1/START domain